MIQNNTYVCFKGEKVEKYDQKHIGPDFWSPYRIIVTISMGNNSSNSKAFNLKF